MPWSVECSRRWRNSRMLKACRTLWTQRRMKGKTPYADRDRLYSTRHHVRRKAIYSATRKIVFPVNQEGWRVLMLSESCSLIRHRLFIEYRILLKRRKQQIMQKQEQERVQVWILRYDPSKRFLPSVWPGRFPKGISMFHFPAHLLLLPILQFAKWISHCRILRSNPLKWLLIIRLVRHHRIHLHLQRFSARHPLFPDHHRLHPHHQSIVFDLFLPKCLLRLLYSIIDRLHPRHQSIVFDHLLPKCLLLHLLCLIFDLPSPLHVLFDHLLPESRQLHFQNHQIHLPFQPLNRPPFQLFSHLPFQSFNHLLLNPLLTLLRILFLPLFTLTHLLYLSPLSKPMCHLISKTPRPPSNQLNFRPFQTSSILLSRTDIRIRPLL